MNRLIPCLIALVAFSACNTVRPNYQVRHGPLGSKADVRELRVTAPGYKPYATFVGALGLGLLTAGAANSIDGLIIGGVVGAIMGIPVDLLLSVYGIYPGEGTIFACPKLRSSHTMTMVSDAHVNTILDELKCKRVAKTLH
jgi:hypothetical protein